MNITVSVQSFAIVVGLNGTISVKETGFCLH